MSIPKMNTDKLVKLAALGKVQGLWRFGEYEYNRKGNMDFLPGLGSISYNVDLGDNCFGWEADHIQPGVAVTSYGADTNDDVTENETLNAYACIGNEVEIIQSESPVRGKKGFIAGQHGGIDQVIVYFPQEVKERIRIGDNVQIRVFGQGLKLLDYPDIKVYNIDPWVLEVIDVSENKRKHQVKVPVAHIVPGCLLGSGVGDDRTYGSDFDIMTQDTNLITKLGLDKLKLGDIIAWEDIDATHGPCYIKGAMSIGVVVHGDCIYPGHGPGVVFIMTAPKEVKGQLVPVKYKNGINLREYFDQAIISNEW